MVSRDRSTVAHATAIWGCSHPAWTRFSAPSCSKALGWGWLEQPFPFGRGLARGVQIADYPPLVGLAPPTPARTPDVRSLGSSYTTRQSASQVALPAGERGGHHGGTVGRAALAACCSGPTLLFARGTLPDGRGPSAGLSVCRLQLVSTRCAPPPVALPLPAL